MGQVGNVWVDIGGDASDLKRAAQESIASLEKIRETAANLGLSNVSDDFLKLNRDILSTADVSSKAAQGIDTSMSSIFGGFKDFGIALAGINQGLELVKKGIRAVEQVWDFAEEGSRFASLEQASYRLADSYGASMSSIVASVKAASFNTITEYDAMKAANLAMTMGVSTDATEIANLMEIAIERGRAFGITTEESFDRITRGIGRRSTRLLDDLGFSADATHANKVYAESLGIETSELTDQMRVRALFNQILKQGNIELEKSGGLAEDISTPYQAVSTAYDEFWNTIKQRIAYEGLSIITTKKKADVIREQAVSYGILTGSYSDYVEAYQRLSGEEKGRTYSAETGMTFTNPVLTKAQFAQAQSLTAQYDAYKDLKTEIGGMTEATNKFGYALSDLVDEESLMVGLSGEIAQAHETYAEAMKQAGRNTTKQKTAIDDLNESYQSFILDTMQSLGFDPMATMTVGMKFGEVDKMSMALFAAIGEVQDLGLGATETAEKILDIYNNFNEVDNIKFQDKSLNILVNFLINGIPTYDFTSFSKYMIGGFGGVNINKPLDINAKHGGSFVGLAHGGIVPPGFSNDGMPVWVGSGERLNVTPAGNKTINDGGATVNRFYGPVTLKIDKTTAKDVMKALQL